MRTFKPKSTDQLRAIFGLGKNVNMAKEDLEELAFDVTGERTSRLSELSFDEANAMITRLGGDAFPANGTVPIRTQNYRKQKAGVKTLVTQHQLNLMNTLASGRNMSPEGLEKMGTRMIKHWPVRTTSECNKMIEALKDMNARDAKKLKEAA